MWVSQIHIPNIFSCRLVVDQWYTEGGLTLRSLPYETLDVHKKETRIGRATKIAPIDSSGRDLFKFIIFK